MSINGWLSPNGLFFPCEHYKHNQGAGTGLTETELEARGYVKISDNRFHKAYGGLTQWQEDKLEQLGLLK